MLSKQAGKARSLTGTGSEGGRHLGRSAGRPAAPCNCSKQGPVRGTRGGTTVTWMWRMQSFYRRSVLSGRPQSEGTRIQIVAASLRFDARGVPRAQLRRQGTLATFPTAYSEPSMNRTGQSGGQPHAHNGTHTHHTSPSPRPQVQPGLACRCQPKEMKAAGSAAGPRPPFTSSRSIQFDALFVRRACLLLPGRRPLCVRLADGWPASQPLLLQSRYEQLLERAASLHATCLGPRVGAS